MIAEILSLETAQKLAAADQLQTTADHWNELKKFINSGYYDSYIYSSTILNKMQELEGENNNEEESNSK